MSKYKRPKIEEREKKRRKHGEISKMFVHTPPSRHGHTGSRGGVNEEEENQNSGSRKKNRDDN